MLPPTAVGLSDRTNDHAALALRVGDFEFVDCFGNGRLGVGSRDGSQPLRSLAAEHGDNPFLGLRCAGHLSLVADGARRKLDGHRFNAGGLVVVGITRLARMPGASRQG